MMDLQLIRELAQSAADDGDLWQMRIQGADVRPSEVLKLLDLIDDLLRVAKGWQDKALRCRQDHQYVRAESYDLSARAIIDTVRRYTDE